MISRNRVAKLFLIYYHFLCPQGECDKDSSAPGEGKGRKQRSFCWERRALSCTGAKGGANFSSFGGTSNQSWSWHSSWRERYNGRDLLPQISQSRRICSRGRKAKNGLKALKRWFCGQYHVNLMVHECEFLPVHLDRDFAIVHTHEWPHSQGEYSHAQGYSWALCHPFPHMKCKPAPLRHRHGCLPGSCCTQDWGGTSQASVMDSKSVTLSSSRSRTFAEHCLRTQDKGLASLSWQSGWRISPSTQAWLTAAPCSWNKKGQDLWWWLKQAGSAEISEPSGDVRGLQHWSPTLFLLSTRSQGGPQKIWVMLSVQLHWLPNI